MGLSKKWQAYKSGHKVDGVQIDPVQYSCLQVNSMYTQELEKCFEQAQRFDTCPTCMEPFGDNSSCEETRKEKGVLIAVIVLGVIIIAIQILLGLCWYFGKFQKCCQKKKV